MSEGTEYLEERIEQLRSDFQAMRLDLALLGRDMQQVREQALNHLPSALNDARRDIKDLSNKTERLFGVAANAQSAKNGAANWKQAFYVVLGVLSALFIELVKRFLAL